MQFFREKPSKLHSMGKLLCNCYAIGGASVPKTDAEAAVGDTLYLY